MRLLWKQVKGEFLSSFKLDLFVKFSLKKGNFLLETFEKISLPLWLCLYETICMYDTYNYMHRALCINMITHFIRKMHYCYHWMQEVPVYNTAKFYVWKAYITCFYRVKCPDKSLCFTPKFGTSNAILMITRVIRIMHGAFQLYRTSHVVYAWQWMRRQMNGLDRLFHRSGELNSMVQWMSHAHHLPHLPFN